MSCNMMNLVCSRRSLLRYLSWRWGVSRKLTRPNVAQQECPCRKKPGSVRGKTSPIFPSFASKLSRTALTYSLGPGFGWHGRSGLLAAIQPCPVELRMAGVHGKGHSCHVLPNSLHAVFSTWVLHTSPHRARWSRDGVPVNQYFPERKHGWQMCQLSSQLLQSKEHSLCCGSAPVSAQPAPAYTQTAQASDILSTHTTACTISQYFEKKIWLNSDLGCNVPRAGLGFGGSIVLSGKSESAVSKAVMIKCPSVELKGQKQLVFLLVRLRNGNTHKLRIRARKKKLEWETWRGRAGERAASAASWRVQSSC